MLLGIVYGVGLGVAVQIALDLPHSFVKSLVLLLLLPVPFLPGKLRSQDVLKSIRIHLLHIHLGSGLLRDAVIGVEVLQQLVVVLLGSEVSELRRQLCGVGLAIDGDGMLGSICAPFDIGIRSRPCIPQLLQHFVEQEAVGQHIALRLRQFQGNRLSIAVVELLHGSILEVGIILVE